MTVLAEPKFPQVNDLDVARELAEQRRSVLAPPSRYTRAAFPLHETVNGRPFTPLSVAEQYVCDVLQSTCVENVLADAGVGDETDIPIAMRIESRKAASEWRSLDLVSSIVEFIM
ncbi:MAG: hypothetical protein ACOH14_02085 [Rhodoglobus sp.]